MAESIPLSQSQSWFRRAPWLILVTGLIVALVVTVLLLMVLMQPPLPEVGALVTTLTISSLLSLGMGYVLYRRGWSRFTSLSRTLIMTYAWAALLTLVNVGILQQQMFVSDHDLILGGILLLFAAIIATAFGVFVSASVTDDLRQLSDSARRLAGGDLSARAQVRGRDEIALVGQAFNDMAVQLEQLETQRQELDQLRRDFIAWTSHDLRTPLTGIRVRVEALHDGLLEENPQERRRYYQLLLADLLALNQLIDDLFELAQLEAGGLKIERVPTALGELLFECLQRLEVQARARDVELQGTVAEGVDPVMLNPSKISRVLTNLLSNAIRHASSAGWVHVQAERTAEGVIVTVEDNGPGFDPEDLPRIFEQFYRGEPARSRATGGAGLGLAIAQGIVQAHGGRIWAENTEHGGARVMFFLPD